MKRLVLPAVIALAAVAGSSSHAADTAAEVRDPAHLFSPPVRKQAEARLAQLEAEHGYPLFVESMILEPEPEKSYFLRFLKRRRAARQLLEEGRKRAAQAGVRGLYVFICAEPRAVQVIAWPEPEENLFSTHECDMLRKRVNTYLKDGPDAALQTAVTELEDHLREQKSITETPIFFYAVLAIGLAALWLVLTMASRRFAEQPQASAGEVSGFGSALLAAQLGFPAAGWIYDRFFVQPRDLLGEEVPPEPLLAPAPPAVVQKAENEQGADTSASL